MSSTKDQQGARRTTSWPGWLVEAACHSKEGRVGGATDSVVMCCVEDDEEFVGEVV